LLARINVSWRFHCFLKAILVGGFFEKAIGFIFMDFLDNDFNFLVMEYFLERLAFSLSSDSTFAKFPAVVALKISALYDGIVFAMARGTAPSQSNKQDDRAE
jgi:hypothetical protein